MLAVRISRSVLASRNIRSWRPQSAFQSTSIVRGRLATRSEDAAYLVPNFRAATSESPTLFLQWLSSGCSHIIRHIV